MRQIVKITAAILFFSDVCNLSLDRNKTSTVHFSALACSKQVLLSRRVQSKADNVRELYLMA